MKTLIKLINGKEVSRKEGYANSENTTNAGNSWIRDCRVHRNELKTRSFEIIDTEIESKKESNDWCEQLAIQNMLFEPNYSSFTGNHF